MMYENKEKLGKTDLLRYPVIGSEIVIWIIVT